MKQELSRKGWEPSIAISDANERKKLQVQETNAWKCVLGSDVVVIPPPLYLTPAIERKLRNFGLALRFFPKLDLNLTSLQDSDVKDYLYQLTSRYPNWSPFEGLTERERANHSIVRNLAQDFWESVKKGEIRISLLSSYWLAVETVPKPFYGHHYPETLLMHKLGVYNRFSYSPLQLTEKIRHKKEPILTELSLPKETEVRLPEAIEWNLLANREGWGKTNAYEWTNTSLTPSDGKSEQIIIGGKDLGGVASFHSLPGNQPYDMAGFRLVFVLQS